VQTVLLVLSPVITLVHPGPHCVKCSHTYYANNS